MIPESHGAEKPRGPILAGIFFLAVTPDTPACKGGEVHFGSRFSPQVSDSKARQHGEDSRAPHGGEEVGTLKGGAGKEI